ASLADQANGGPGGDPQMGCLPSGMPRMMIGYWPFEFVITPDTIHVLGEHIHSFRRIYTDGRDWPEVIEPSFAGYSIGRWVDSKGFGPVRRAGSRNARHERPACDGFDRVAAAQGQPDDRQGTNLSG